MALKHNLLSELIDDKDDYVIKVRVIRIWDSTNIKTKQILSTNILLLDEEVYFNSIYLLLISYDFITNKIFIYRIIIYWWY